MDAVVMRPEPLGINRKGNAIMCYARGETEVPVVRTIRTVDELTAFIAEEWLGDVNDPELPKLLQEVADHDWYEGGPKVWEFEIGGVRLEDVEDCGRASQVDLAKKLIAAFRGCDWTISGIVNEPRGKRQDCEHFGHQYVEQFGPGITGDDYWGHAYVPVEGRYVDIQYSA